MLFMQKDLGLHTHAEQQLTVAILLLGAVVGAAIAGWAADRFSRRRVKITSGCVYVIGALGCAFSQTYPQILASRFWLGLAVGTASFVSPMYIAEIVPPRIRGGVVSFNQLMVTLGILAAYIVDWGFAGFSNNWRWMFGVAVIPGAILAIGMYFMPFSPRWLVEKGREDDARQMLSRYRDSDEDVEERDPRDPGDHRGGVQPAGAPGQGRPPDDDRRRRARDLPADRRHQHGHLLRAHDPQVRRPAEHGRADPERLHRLHERVLHDRCDPAARQARPPVLPHRRYLDADRGAHRPRDLLRVARASSRATAGSRSRACSSTSRASRSGSGRCSG